jgi:glycosyltransferase involved in cell wall biosynthesis
MDGMAWEAIVADGMSNDGTREVLEAYAKRHPQLVLVDNPKRIVSTGLNAAIRASRGDFILRMDAHTRYEPDYCRLCIETLIATGAANAGGPARTEAHGAVAEAIAAAYHSPFSTGGAKFHDEEYEGWVDTVPYGCWRRETFSQIGFFDETLVRNQDDEFNLRLLNAGGKIWQNPRILSCYSPRATLAGLFWQYFQYGYWKVAVIRKHRLPGSWRHLVPAIFVAVNLTLLAGAGATAIAGHGLQPCGFLWLAMAAAYASAIFLASAMTARRHGWPTLPYLPLTFATYHFSYGLGFLAGLLAGLGRGRRSLQEAGIFTRVTR